MSVLRSAIRRRSKRILAHRSGELDATGIAEPGRPWRLVIRRLSQSAVHGSNDRPLRCGVGRKDARRFRRQRQP